MIVAEFAATTIALRLEAALGRFGRSGPRVSELRRLSGGASQESWSFTATSDRGAERLILRRAPVAQARADYARPLATEAALVAAAHDAGVPAAEVIGVLGSDDGLGEGFVMRHVDGETIARKIQRDDAYTAARPRFAAQCGTILARIHALPTEALPPLPTFTASDQLDDLGRRIAAQATPRPVFELALRWLGERMPADDATPVLVHGDFRLGNLIVGGDGVCAVLDWELAHLGDPAEDLGWLCVRSWRFGAVDRPVGGLGAREDLIDAYNHAAAMPVTAAAVRFWEMLGTLRWGVMCMEMFEASRLGCRLSVERAMIGRRVSETELDLMHILTREAA